jgi:hypothetical protein
VKVVAPRDDLPVVVMEAVLMVRVESGVAMRWGRGEG